MNTANYQEIIDDLEVKSVILQADCDELRETLNTKSKHLRYVVDTITVLKGLMEIEAEDAGGAKSTNDKTNYSPAKMTEWVTNQLNENKNEIVAPVEYNEENQSSVTLNDGSETILKQSSKPLHVDELVKRLETLGRFTTKRSLNSTLIQDSKKRFVLLGENTFDLRNRQSDSLFPEFRAGAVVAGTEKTPTFVLTDAIREIVKELNGKEFSVSEMFDTLQARYPDQVSETRRKSIASTLNNIRLKGELKKVREGTMDSPAVYRAINKG